MAATLVKGKKIPGSATIREHLRVGGDLHVEGTVNFVTAGYTNLTVTNLTATNATITTGTVATLNSTTGTITTLNSTTGTIATLNSTTGTITTLNSTTGTITTLNSTTATITNLTVSNNLTLGGVSANAWVWVPSGGARSGEGLGAANQASGPDSLAFGDTCSVAAGAGRSMAIGQNCVCNASAATNGEQFSGGFFCTTSGRGSFSFGRNCASNSISAVTFGQLATVGTNSNHSFAAGNTCTVANNCANSIAIGDQANVAHPGSFVFGCGVNNTYSTGAGTNTISQANFSFTVGATGGAFFGLGGGNMLIDGAVVTTCDESLKEDIQDFNTVALTAINNIPIKRYKRKVSPSNDSQWTTDWYKHEVGFLIGDLPTILRTGPNNSCVNTLSCIAGIFKALQEIRAFQLNLRQDVDNLLEIVIP